MLILEKENRISNLSTYLKKVEKEEQNKTKPTRKKGDNKEQKSMTLETENPEKNQ